MGRRPGNFVISNRSEVIMLTDKCTDRHPNAQTDATENNAILAALVVIVIEKHKDVLV